MTIRYMIPTMVQVSKDLKVPACTFFAAISGSSVATTAAIGGLMYPELVKRGFQLVTVSELASYRGGMIPGKSYSQFRPIS